MFEICLWILLIIASDALGGIKMKNEEEEQEQLRFIAMKIDADQNGEISREEMRNYIEQRMK